MKTFTQAFPQFNRVSHFIASLLFLFFLSFNTQAFSVIQVGTGTSSGSTVGPTVSTLSGPRYERHIALYTAAEISAGGISNGYIMNIAWNKLAAQGYTAGNMQWTISMKLTSQTTFATTSITWATEISGATQVYNSTTQNIPVLTTGWIDFPLTTAFQWNGTQSVEVFVDIYRPGNWSGTVSWQYTSVTNTSSGTSGTTAPTTVARSSLRPNVQFAFSTTGADAGLLSMPNPVSSGPGVQNIDVVLRNTGNTTLTGATIDWTINGGSPTTYTWSGSLAIGASATVTLASPNLAFGTNVIVATITSANGGTDQYAANNSITKTILTCNPLSGNYTINDGAATGGTNFNNFTDFAYYLSSCGVSANVTATVAAGSGPYTEQVNFQNIPGLGAGATITIQGNGRTITSDTAINQTGSNPNRHIIRLTDIQYFTINNLHVDMFPGSTGFMGIHVYNTGSNITISNCVIDMSSSVSTLVGGIAATGSQSSLLTGGNFSNLTFTGNTTTGGGYGAVMYGLAGTPVLTSSITGNTFNSSSSWGVYIHTNTGTVIGSNNINFTATGGIQLAGTANLSVLVEKNVVQATNPTTTTTLSGILVFGSTAGVNANKVINNLVWKMNAPLATVYGIEARTSGAIFYFNTVILDDATSTGLRSLAFTESSANTGSILKNNIFFVTRPSSNYGAALALNSASAVATALNSNNNVFYVSGSTNYVAVKQGSLSADPPTNTYATLSAWQSASTQDGASFQTNPFFQTNTAIPTNGVINDQAATGTGVTTDITNATRGAAPDPGAYEFVPPANDGAITNFVSPGYPYCATTLAVQFTLTNAGTSPLTSATINWTVNGSPQTVVNWSGPSLAAGSSANVTLGNVPVTGNNTYIFSATVSNPNGVTDPNATNNTFTFTGFRRGFSGTITVNASAAVSATNYQTIQSAADALSFYGVCGPVTVSVLNGPYTEQVVILNIPGTTATNTVTFNGNNNVLQFTPTSSYKYVLQLKATNYIIIKNFIVTSLSATYGWGINIIDGSSQIAIRNNTVNVSLTETSATNCMGIMTSGTTNYLNGTAPSDSIEVSGNTVNGGGVGIQMVGNFAIAQRNTNVAVFNNTVKDFYSEGIQFLGAQDVLVSGNDISRPNRTNSGSPFYAIYFWNAIENYLIQKNRIHDIYNTGMTGTINGGAIHVLGNSTYNSSGTIANNLIYNFTNNGYQYGINANVAAAATANIYHNTIVFDHTASASTALTLYRY